jgi:uncharacterized protein YgbK (DUF1537 family)
MGGMAWRHGLSAEVRTGSELGLEEAPGPDADVIVLDTDTRSSAPAEAARRVSHVAARCREWGAAGVYKKVDSVLRGPVAAELAALRDALRVACCLLVPANPGLGRVIAGGHYLVNGVLLHETDFRLDPEYPAVTADVLERLRAVGPDRSGPLYLRSPGQALPDGGTVVGQAACAADLDAWAGTAVRPGVVPAGASEFFGAYLQALGHRPAGRVPEFEAGKKACTLFVCGSTSAGSRGFCRQSEARGVPVLRLPHALLQRPVQAPGAGAWIERWADEVVRALAKHSRAVLAIDRPLSPDPGMPRVLGEYLSGAVEQVLGRVKVERLFAEGGATVAALARRMGWPRLRVRSEWATGAVSLEVVGQAAPLVSMKPGSYAWPDPILARIW